MGSVFQTATLDGTLDRNAVRKRFLEIQDQDRHENGHSYSGGFGMASGLEFRERSFPTVSEAKHWLDENVQKWEAALCVRAKKADKDVWVIGALCSS